MSEKKSVKPSIKAQIEQEICWAKADLSAAFANRKRNLALMVDKLQHADQCLDSIQRLIQPKKGER
jgi:hypothetical protein